MAEFDNMGFMIRRRIIISGSGFISTGFRRLMKMGGCQGT